MRCRAAARRPAQGALEPEAPVPERMLAGAAWIGELTAIVAPAGVPEVKKAPP